jgi:hypothetical protein
MQRRSKKGREAWIRAQAEWLRQSLGITKPIELTAASQAQLNAIGQFFHDHCFGRVAAVLTDRALLDPSLKPYAIVARSLLERIAEIARHHPISNVALVFEESTRTDALAATFFEGYRLQIGQMGQPVRQVSIQKFRMAKSSGEAMLARLHRFDAEKKNITRTSVWIAKDEMIQSSQNGLWCRPTPCMDGAVPSGRKDFDVVFRAVDPRIISFCEITEAKQNPT